MATVPVRPFLIIDGGQGCFIRGLALPEGCLSPSVIAGHDTLIADLIPSSRA